MEGLAEAANLFRDVIRRKKKSAIVIAEIQKDADKTGKPHSGQFKYCDKLFSSCDTSILLWTDDDPKRVFDQATGLWRRQKVYFTIDKNRGGGVSDNTIYFDRPRMTFYEKP